MSLWIALAIVVLAGLLVARRFLPDRATVADAVYDAWRALVPAPKPTVRLVTKRVARVCRKQRVDMPYGQQAVLPRAFLVGISSPEYAVVEPLLDTVQEAVSAGLVRTAREKQWLYAGPPRIVVQDSETAAEGRPEVLSTTLPAPGTLTAGGARALAGGATLPREVTATWTDPADLSLTAHDTGEPMTRLPAVEATHDLASAAGGRPPADPGAYSRDHRAAPVTCPEPTRGRPPLHAVPPLRPVVDLGPQPDLRAEPTSAETGGAGPGGIVRLRGSGGLPDIVLTGTPLTVGRWAECDVQVTYPAASRRHLRLVPTPAGCRVEDLDSRHGTRVNGALVRQPVLLRARDTLQLGSAGPCWTYQPVGSMQPAPGHPARAEKAMSGDGGWRR